MGTMVPKLAVEINETKEAAKLALGLWRTESKNGDDLLGLRTHPFGSKGVTKVVDGRRGEEGFFNVDV